MNCQLNELYPLLKHLNDSSRVTAIYNFYIFDNDAEITALDLYEYDISLENVLYRNQHMYQAMDVAFDIGERRQDILIRCKLVPMYDQIYVDDNNIFYEHTIFNYLGAGYKLVFMGYNHAMLYKNGKTMTIHKKFEWMR